MRRYPTKVRGAGAMASPWVSMAEAPPHPSACSTSRRGRKGISPFSVKRNGALLSGPRYAQE